MHLRCSDHDFRMGSGNQVSHNPMPGDPFYIEISNRLLSSKNGLEAYLATLSSALFSTVTHIDVVVRWPRGRRAAPDIPPCPQTISITSFLCRTTVHTRKTCGLSLGIWNSRTRRPYILQITDTRRHRQGQLWACFRLYCRFLLPASCFRSSNNSNNHELKVVVVHKTLLRNLDPALKYMVGIKIIWSWQWNYDIVEYECGSGHSENIQSIQTS